MCRKLKRGLEDSIDKILERYEVEKAFGHPISDFDTSYMTTTQIKSIKKLISNKIDSYGR